MQPYVEFAPASRDLEMDEDQYRRPSCGQRKTVQSEDSKLGPGTAQLLHLLNEIGV